MCWKATSSIQTHQTIRQNNLLPGHDWRATVNVFQVVWCTRCSFIRLGMWQTIRVENQRQRLSLTVSKQEELVSTPLSKPLMCALANILRKLTQVHFMLFSWVGVGGSRVRSPWMQQTGRLQGNWHWHWHWTVWDVFFRGEGRRAFNVTESRHFLRFFFL